jgi:hypothetical protein
MLREFKVQNEEELLAWINWALSRYIMDQKLLRGIYPEALYEQGAITVIGYGLFFIYIWKGILVPGQVIGQTAL